ncbi:hypothetical protein D3C80_1552040 [compost metagenome]
MGLACLLDELVARHPAHASTGRTATAVHVVQRFLPERPMLRADDLHLGAVGGVDHPAVVIAITMLGHGLGDELFLGVANLPVPQRGFLIDD